MLLFWRYSTLRVMCIRQERGPSDELWVRTRSLHLYGGLRLLCLHCGGRRDSAYLPDGERVVNVLHYNRSILWAHLAIPSVATLQPYSVTYPSTHRPPSPSSPFPPHPPAPSSPPSQLA